MNYFLIIATIALIFWVKELNDEIKHLNERECIEKVEVGTAPIDGNESALDSSNSSVDNKKYDRGKDNRYIDRDRDRDRDSDGDGLSDNEERRLGLDGNRRDTDGDGISDYNEVKLFETNPQLVDTDSDEIDDRTELHKYGTDPLAEDTDRDGLDDYEEIYEQETNPKLSDTDGDGVSDYREVFVYETDPLTPESSESEILEDIPSSPKAHNRPQRYKNNRSNRSDRSVSRNSAEENEYERIATDPPDPNRDLLGRKDLERTIHEGEISFERMRIQCQDDIDCYRDFLSEYDLRQDEIDSIIEDYSLGQSGGQDSDGY